MYKISNYSGKIKIGNVIFPQDERESLYPEYLAFLQSGGTPEFVDYFEGELEAMTIEKQIKDEFSAYEIRRKDGIDAYNQINAEFRIMKNNGVIDQSYYDSISEVLEGVIFQITNGQWVSALPKLEAVGSSQIGQQLYDRLHLQIVNYISKSY